jgi:mannosyltransferase
MRARHLQLLAGITLAGALLRFTTLGVQSYWLDEAATVNLLHKGFGSMISGVASGESTPPLYYILAWIWAKVFGTSEAGLRSLSALFGTATIPVAYVLGRLVAGRRTGLVAAALCAFNPLLVWYSQEARSYALMILLTGLSLIALIRVLETPRTGRLAAWALVSIAAIATHYYAGFLIGAEALWLLYRTQAKGRAFTATAAVAAAALAFLPLALHQRSTGAAAFISASSIARRLAQIPKQFVLGYHGPFEIVAVILTAVLLAYAAFRLLAAVPGRERTRALVLAGLGIAAIVAPLVLALIGPDYLIARNVIASWLPLGVAVATGFAAGRAPREGIVAAGLLCAIGVVMVLAVDFHEQYQRDDWRGAAQALGTSGQGRAIIVTPPSGRIPLLLYLKRARPVVSPGVDVRELDMVGLAPRLPGQAPSPPRPPVIAINQFSEFARKEAQTYTVVREGSATKQRIQESTGASPLDGRPGVTIYQAPPPR